MTKAKPTKAKPTKAKPNRRPASTGLDWLYAAARQVGIECLDNEWRGKDAHYRLRCAHGHEFMRAPSTLSIMSIICPECRDNARLARIQAVAAQRGGRCLETRYLGKSARYRFVCAEGHPWAALPGSIVHAKAWCPRCKPPHRLLKNGLELLQAVAQARGGACLTSVYAAMKAHYVFRCAEGHEWEAIGNEIVLNRSWCPRCAPIRQPENRLGFLQATAQARGGSCLTSVYAGIKALYVFRCAEGHEWEAAGQKVAYSKTWCPLCAKTAQVGTSRPHRLLENGLELIQAAAQARGGSCLASVYAGMTALYVFRCAEGHEWEAPGRAIRYNWSWCALCVKARKSATLAKKNLPIKAPPARSKLKHQSNLVVLRKGLGLNQRDFWSALGVTQGGGSRYECGRRVPKSIAILLDLLYVRGIDVTKLQREDMAILQFIEESQPNLYTALLKGMRDDALHRKKKP